MKSSLFIFFVFFYGCSFFTQFSQPKIVKNENAQARAVPSPTPSPAYDDLLTEAKVENLLLKLDDCRLTFSGAEKSESFDFGFKGICGFEKNPDDPAKPRTVKTPNGSVFTVIGIEKTAANDPADKHSQPCNTIMRRVIVRNGEVFLSAKTSDKKGSCVTQLDEKDYFIFSKDSVTLDQAEKDKKP